MTQDSTDALIDSLTDEQLDRLDQRLTERRRQVAEQPVFCPRCGGIGIEWSAGYAHSSDLGRCSTCNGVGWMPRGAVSNAKQRDWDDEAATTETLENVAAQQYRMRVTRRGAIWHLEAPKWRGEVRTSQHVDASYELSTPTGEFSLYGTGKLWMAVHYSCRGIEQLIVKERIGHQVTTG